MRNVSCGQFDDAVGRAKLFFLVGSVRSGSTMCEPEPF